MKFSVLFFEYVSLVGVLPTAATPVDLPREGLASAERVQFSRVVKAASFSFSTVSNTSELPSHLTVLVN
jgi:hypothetical protein